MKVRHAILLVVIGLAPMYSFAQQSSQTIEDQFTEVMESSNRYKEYKVIKVNRLNTLQANVLDSVQALRATIATNGKTINQLESRIDSLEQNTQNLSNELATSRKKENGIEVFGAIIEKSLYQTILYSIIGLLVLLAIILFFRYRNSNLVTKDAKSKLEETEAEFESHRQRSLEREQQLRRKLQDEINKQKE